MSQTRRKVIEALLVEASENNPRKVAEGSVRLVGACGNGEIIDWSEKTRRGLVARSGLVDWQRFWSLLEAALGD